MVLQLNFLSNGVAVLLLVKKELKAPEDWQTASTVPQCKGKDDKG